MDFFKLVSRYVIMTVFIGLIHFFKLTFFGVVALKTICFIALCIYLDYIVPKYCSIEYHEKIDEKNKISFGVMLRILVNYCLYIFGLYLAINKQYSDYPIMTINDILINYAYSIPLSILSSVIFYYIHRFMHTKYLYGIIHKTHHTYNHPSSFVGLFTSIPEFIFSNCASFYIPHFIIRPHPYFVFGYTFIGLCDVFINHTSYSFNNNTMNNLFGGSYFHYIHHAKNKYNFGLNNKLFDHLHKTCDPTNLKNHEIY